MLAAPLLKVGWTLNYEMLFYVIFTMALFLGKSPLKFTAVIFSPVEQVDAMRPVPLKQTPPIPFPHARASLK